MHQLIIEVTIYRAQHFGFGVKQRWALQHASTCKNIRSGMMGHASPSSSINQLARPIVYWLVSVSEQSQVSTCCGSCLYCLWGYQSKAFGCGCGTECCLQPATWLQSEDEQTTSAAGEWLDCAPRLFSVLGGMTGHIQTHLNFYPQKRRRRRNYDQEYKGDHISLKN